MDRFEYYACLQRKDGTVEKKKCKTRREARDYITDNYDPLIHIQCWTE